MNDPSFAFGKVWAPISIVERAIVLMHVRLARSPEVSLTDEFLEAQYSSLLDSLVDSGTCVVTSFTRPTISREVWFAHQRSQVARFRE